MTEPMQNADYVCPGCGSRTVDVSHCGVVRCGWCGKTKAAQDADNVAAVDWDDEHCPNPTWCLKCGEMWEYHFSCPECGMCAECECLLPSEREWLAHNDGSE